MTAWPVSGDPSASSEESVSFSLPWKPISETTDLGQLWVARILLFQIIISVNINSSYFNLKMVFLLRICFFSGGGVGLVEVGVGVGVGVGGVSMYNIIHMFVWWMSILKSKHLVFLFFFLGKGVGLVYYVLFVAFFFSSDLWTFGCTLMLLHFFIIVGDSDKLDF